MMATLMVGTRKGLFVFEETDGDWRRAQLAFRGDPVVAVAQDPRSGNLYAALRHGHFGNKLHRSGDGGVSWEEIAVPEYPPLPEGAEPDRCPMRGIEIPWTLDYLWTLTPGHASQPGRLWAGTIPGGLFRSDDHGDSWQLVESLWRHPARKKWMGGGFDYPGIHSIFVDPRDPKRITLAVSCGGVWESTDDGVSWNNVGQGLRADYAPPEMAYLPDTQDVHRMAICPADPERGWIQHHNGIFRSDDGGHNWVECSDVAPSAFGFGVAVHPTDPNTAWFVPAQKDEMRIPVGDKLVVTRTRDAGASFDILDNGLPDEAYDLIYRHALDVDASGDRLAFGSTTGNLYTSGDGGDSWHTINVHLPPIYCLAWLRR